MSKEEAVNVLLVDDQPGKLLSYQVMLEELGENLVPVTSAQEALAFLLKTEVAVMLVHAAPVRRVQWRRHSQNPFLSRYRVSTLRKMF